MKTRNISFTPIIVACFTILLASCSNTGGYGTDANNGNEYGSSAKKEAMQDAENTTTTVTIQNFAFSPSVVTISAGDTLVFINKDGAPHNATADTFKTATLNKGESGSITIADAGTYEYICSIHPSMKGTIIVK